MQICDSCCEKQITRKRERERERGGGVSGCLKTQPVLAILRGFQSMILSQLASDKREGTEKGRRQQL